MFLKRLRVLTCEILLISKLIKGYFIIDSTFFPSALQESSYDVALKSPTEQRAALLPFSFLLCTI